MFNGVRGKLISAENPQWWLKEMLLLGEITEIQTSVKLETSLHIWGSCNSCLHSAFSLGWGWEFEVSLHSYFSHLNCLKSPEGIQRSVQVGKFTFLLHWRNGLCPYVFSWCGICGMIWGRVLLWCFIPPDYCRAASVSVSSELCCFSLTSVHKNILPFLSYLLSKQQTQNSISSQGRLLFL